MARSIRLAFTLLLMLPIGALTAAAAEFPSKPIRIIVGYLPGAATDFSARVVAAKLSVLLHQPVIVENRPGAASVVAVQYVSHSPPDGYTLLWGNGDAIAILPAVKPSVPYKIPDSLTMIVRTATYGLAVVVNSNLPIRSIAELVAYAKSHPGKLRFGSSGVGGALHVATLLFAQQAGIELTHVPYNGALPMMTDLLGGFINMGITTLLTAGPGAKAGSVRLLAVTSGERDSLWPDLPTLKEAGYPGATVVDWFGLFGPPTIPANVVQTLNAAVVEALADPDVQRQLATSDLTAAALSGEAFRTFVTDDLKRWEAVANSANIHISDVQ